MTEPPIETHPPSKCPTCRKILDVCVSLGEVRTIRVPGDFSVCGYCGDLLRFDDGLVLRRATAKDRRDLSEENREAVAQAQHLIRLRRGAS